MLAQAEGAPVGAQPDMTQGLMGMLPMIVALFAVMYFLIIRPQNKRERERRDMLESLAKGDSVVTTGGICGTIVRLDEHHVILNVDDKVDLRFVRSAIHQVTKKEKEGEAK